MTPEELNDRELLYKLVWLLTEKQIKAFIDMYNNDGPTFNFVKDTILSMSYGQVKYAIADCKIALSSKFLPKFEDV